jgi:hypothetical protein
MNQLFAKPLHNRCTLHFRAVFDGSQRPSFSNSVQLEVFDFFRVVGEWLFGSDGWNRTTDLGVMNPTL